MIGHLGRRRLGQRPERFGILADRAASDRRTSTRSTESRSGRRSWPPGSRPPLAAAKVPGGGLQPADRIGRARHAPSPRTARCGPRRSSPAAAARSGRPSPRSYPPPCYPRSRLETLAGGPRWAPGPRGREPRRAHAQDLARVVRRRNRPARAPAIAPLPCPTTLRPFRRQIRRGLPALPELRSSPTGPSARAAPAAICSRFSSLPLTYTIEPAAIVRRERQPLDRRGIGHRELPAQADPGRQRGLCGQRGRSPEPRGVVELRLHPVPAAAAVL